MSSQKPTSRELKQKEYIQALEEENAQLQQKLDAIAEIFVGDDDGSDDEEDGDDDDE